MADALTKVVALSEAAAAPLLDRFGAQAIVIDRRGDTRTIGSICCSEDAACLPV